MGISARPVFWALATRACLTLAIAVSMVFSTTIASAQSERQKPRGQSAPALAAPTSGDSDKDVNETTVGIVSGTVTGTYIQFASDLSAVLDEEGSLRILAILGKGSVKNVEDVLHLRGVDIGIVQSDVLTYLEKQKLVGNAKNKIQYITKLYNEEFHLLAGPDINKMEDLAGKKVNFGLQGSGFAVTASIVFDILGIKVEPVYDDPALALEKLKRGEIAATVGVYGKPAKFYAGVKPQGGLHFVPVPYTPELARVYFPSALTGKDYPDMLPGDARVDTIAVGSVMVVFAWPKTSFRYVKVARFVDAFFSRIEDFQKPPRHPKWQEVNLAAPVPGWIRFPAAEEWLKKTGAALPRAAAIQASEPQTANELEAFKQFLSQRHEAPLTAQEEETRKKLFRAFQEWQAARKTQ